MIIASYPRSGSTYLRFILCNLYFPDISHTFETVNKLIPTIESESEILNSTPFGFYKTHETRPYVDFVIVRHVEQCLASQYQYHVNFYGETKTIEQWLEETGYGSGWRGFMNYYIGCKSISYNLLTENANSIIPALTSNEFNPILIGIAIEKSKKSVISKLSPKFISDPLVLSDELKELIYQHNKQELKLYGFNR